jgi:hypothetical protein
MLEKVEHPKIRGIQSGKSTTHTKIDTFENGALNLLFIIFSLKYGGNRGGDSASCGKISGNVHELG